MAKTLALLLLPASIACTAAGDGAVSHHPAEPLRTRDFAWLAGTWSGGTGDRTFTEVWAAPAGGTMMGMLQWVAAGRTRFHEFLVLEEDEEGVVLRFKHIDPGFRPREEEPLTLRASRTSEHEVVFTNTEPGRSPRSLAYRATGDGGLRVRVTALRAGKEQRFELRFRRVRR